jgi:hypothetical protein
MPFSFAPLIKVTPGVLGIEACLMREDSTHFL